MGARGRIIGLALGLAVCGAGSALAEVPAAQESGARTDGAQAVIEEQEKRIEQVYLNLPEISVYGAGFTPEEARTGTGYLGQEKLKLVEASPFSESGEGICYYVLLDISGSVPNAYFQTIKEGIQVLQDSIGAKDRLVLCTFGEEVVLAADGSQTSGEMALILGELKNKDQKTLLFEGIDRVAALSEQTKTEDCRRSVLMVISDGEDISVGRKQAQEAQNTLKEKGIPAYAFCIKDTATANINNFGEFARTSGGALVAFAPDEAGQMLAGLARRLKEDICVRYRASGNVVTNQEEPFALKFADGSVITRTVMNVRWIPDTEAPYLVSGEAAGGRQIRLAFSEPVAGLEGAANYQVRLGDRTVGVTGVSFDQTDGTAVSLFLDEPVVNGVYEISCLNITDCSMEKNPLEGSLKVEITDAGDAKPAQALPTDESPDNTGILFLIFMAVLALVIAIIVKARQKPSDGEKKAGGSGGEAKPVILGEEGFSQHVRIPSRGAQTIYLKAAISMNGTQPKETIWNLHTSLIVGRSSRCDVYFDDPEMSRQHFCLEAEADGLYIKDLNSTNGTSVNGIRIHEKRRMESGSVIEAGSMKITVRW